MQLLIVIFQFMLSVSLGPNVITLSGAFFSSKSKASNILKWNFISNNINSLATYCYHKTKLNYQFFVMVKFLYATIMDVIKIFRPSLCLSLHLPLKSLKRLFYLVTSILVFAMSSLFSKIGNCFVYQNVTARVMFLFII